LALGRINKLRSFNVSRRFDSHRLLQLPYVLPWFFAFSTQTSRQSIGKTALLLWCSAPAFYARVKGELERDVREIGVRSLTILRPSIIEGERDEVRLAENVVLKLSHFLAPILPKRFHVNPAPKIAEVLVDAVVTAEPGSHLRYSDSLV
jgi:hypothetical protein